MKRRTFLKIGVIGVGATALPTITYAFYPLFIRGAPALVKFATAISASMVAERLSHYIWNSPASVSSEIHRANKKLIKNGFTEFSGSRVISTGGVIAYSGSEKNGINSCSPFLNITNIQRCPNTGRILKTAYANTIIMIEGPGMEGLSAAAWDLNRKKYNPEIIKSIFMPQEKIQDANGNFQDGYNHPEKYRTESGTVTLDYKNTSRGKGKIKVVVESRHGTLNNEYKLNYA